MSLRRTIHRLVLVASVGSLAACATPMHAGLDQARTTYDAAASDTEVVKHAAVALHEAKGALSRAESAWEDGDRKETDHRSYLTEQYVEIARARAAREAARASERDLQGKRSEIVLAAREREIEILKSAKQTKRGLVVTLGDVLFEVDRADLKTGAQRELADLVTFLLENTEREVLIEGHTDSDGSSAYNQDLSLKRASSVEGFLIRNGVARRRITSRGYGEQFPVASNADPGGRQQNRRVEIVILEEGESAAAHLRL